MMYWWGDHMGAWSWALMAIGTIAFWGLLILGVVALARYARGSGGAHQAGQPGRPTAEQLLAERYARGEIDEAEFRHRLATLDAVGTGSRPDGGGASPPGS